MSKTHKVRAVDNEGQDVEWSGCGWVPPKRGKRYRYCDAENVARAVNYSGCGVTAWADEVDKVAN